MQSQSPMLGLLPWYTISLFFLYFHSKSVWNIILSVARIHSMVMWHIFFTCTNVVSGFVFIMYFCDFSETKIRCKLLEHTIIYVETHFIWVLFLFLLIGKGKKASAITKWAFFVIFTKTSQSHYVLYSLVYHNAYSFYFIYQLHNFYYNGKNDHMQIRLLEPFYRRLFLLLDKIR